ncbi:MAG TPA: ABC transporter ATP-binding protein [Candidatus Lokiarchaeia archaeon]|nr:ABC transporter ATP-binding protein [Candidatus Lokiarchaeia archaeon]
MANDIIVETTDLVKVYKQGHVRAVDGLNLRVHRGEIYALIGANGSGKTTAIKMLTGILAPTSGTIKIFGLEIPRYHGIVSRRIGVSPQEYSIYQDLTVEENIRFFADIYGMDKESCDMKLAELVQVMRLEDKHDTLGVNLSGGMKRRVSIACALVHSPELILFDEATVGVDPVLRKYFWSYFNSLKETGKAIILTSHVMDEAERADRIGLMRAGRLIDEGTPAELKTRNDVASIEDVFLKLSEGVEIND